MLKEEQSFCPCEQIHTHIVMKEDKLLHVGNDLSHIPMVVNQCLLNVNGVFGDVDLLRIGLSEILVNCIEYGNLEICPDKKQEVLHCSPHDYYSYTRERAQQEEYKGRHLTIKVKKDEKSLIIAIEDQGRGFPWEEVLNKNRTPPEDDTSFCGRGLFLAQQVFDEMIFNLPGNKVQLMKYSTL